MNKIAILFLPFFTGACQSTLPPPVEPFHAQRVEVPGPPIACKPDLGPEPAYFTSAEYLMAPDIQTLIRMYKSDRRLFVARMAEKDAALKKCAGG